MNTDYLRLSIRYSTRMDEAVNDLVLQSGMIGSEVVDPRSVERYENAAPEWELSSRQELLDAQKRQAETDLSDDQVVQRIYFTADESGRSARRALQHRLNAACGAQTVEVLLEDEVVNDHWDEEWKRYYHPVEIGECTLIVPAWERAPETDRTVIYIQPGMAFGTGTHETTSLCLRELETMELRGARCLDVGCGSGILSIFMMKRGAGSCEAFDIDEQALKSCGENIELNRVSVSVESSDLLQKATGRYDVICANLLADLVIRMLERAGDVLAEQGRLVLSGILAERTASVEERLEALGFEVYSRRTDGEWIMLAAKQRSGR
ncbi:MAG: 50S ribosomal protein L11 methyltransferase [Ndongobacter sp.]|nr:50S ribosomal protein L11 methyltransferase [Ndongobacter sp.]